MTLDELRAKLRERILELECFFDQDSIQHGKIKAYYEILEMTKEDNLLPCPFCGDVPNVRKKYLDNIQVFDIPCLNEDCSFEPVSNIWHTTKEDAVLKWNTRFI